MAFIVPGCMLALVTAGFLVADNAKAAARTWNDFPAGVAVLTRWFDHVQRDELDSLPPLLAPEFLFVSEGERFDQTKFVSMIKGLGITHPRVQLSNIVGGRSGDMGYLVYDRVESFESRGTEKVVPETGTIVLVRRRSRWRIVLWTTTAPR